MSLAFALKPSTLSLFLLSAIIQNPSKVVSKQPAAPKLAVVIRAGKYFGASFSRKIFDLNVLSVRLIRGKMVDLRNETHHICHRDSHRCQHDTAVFIRNVIVVPDIENDGRS